MVCHGRGCSVTFAGVLFKSCTLVAVAGAQVVVNEANFKRARGTDQRKGVAIFAHGEHTTVDIRGGRISRGAQGATVQVLLLCMVLLVPNPAFGGVGTQGSVTEKNFQVLFVFVTATEIVGLGLYSYSTDCAKHVKR